MTKQRRVSERSLDEALVRHLRSLPEFEDWLLSRTKFSGVRAELDRAEPWQFRWYRSPDTGLDSETDIFLRFRNVDSGNHFALHIENKPLDGLFRPGQPQDYHMRAKHRMERWRYEDYETILIAPRAFRDRCREECSVFNVYVSYEDLAEFIPEPVYPLHAPWRHRAQSLLRVESGR